MSALEMLLPQGLLNLRLPGPRDDLCRPNRPELSITHTPPSHVTLLGPMPASLARFSKFQEQRRLSLLLRASEAAMALTEISAIAPQLRRTKTAVNAR